MSSNELTTLLTKATQQNIITPYQCEAILALSLSSNTNQAPSFAMAHLLYYFGGLLAIGAMTLFITLGFDAFGSPAIIGICLCYAVAVGGLARYFYQKNLLIPYSLSLGFIVCLVPLLVFAIEDSLGVWDSGTHYQDYHVWINWQWIMMELATLAVGAIMVWRFRRAFLMLPIAVTLWYLSMDIVPMLNGGELDFDLRLDVSIIIGLALILLAFWVDVRQDRSDGQDFAFWLYIVGVVTFFGGLSGNYFDGSPTQIVYLLIYLAMLVVGILIRRKVFVIFGAMGIISYMSYLAYKVFEDSMIFPLIVTLIGLGIIFLGVYWQKNQDAIYTKALSLLPLSVQRTLQKLQTR